MNVTREDLGGPLDVGAVVSGKYRIEGELGVGGCARVFRARNLLLARDVAIKCMRSEHLSDAQRVDSFMREAHTTHHVQHPHIVDVLDVGFHGPVPYIVQELLAGEDLADYLARKGGRVSPREAVERLLPVIDGVAYAHARGVVHCDLRPENVFLAHTPDGVVPKVLDFGVSRVVEVPTWESPPAASSFTGSLAFTAPEQLDGAPDIDARADVWSLGVMLFVLLTGRIPFCSADTESLCMEIRACEPVALDAVAPELSPSLVAIVHRCLRRDRASRYADAGVLAAVLRAQPEAPPARAGRLQIIAPSVAPPALKSELPVAVPARSERAPRRARTSFPAPPPPDPSADEPAALDEEAVADDTAPARDDERPSQRPVVPGLGLPSMRVRVALVAFVLTAVTVAFAWRRASHPRVEPAPVTPIETAGETLPVSEAPPAQTDLVAPPAPEQPTAASQAPSAHSTAPVAHRRTPSVESAAGSHEPQEERAQAAAPRGEEEEVVAPEQPLPPVSLDPIVEQAVADHAEAIDRCSAQAGDARGRVNVRLVIAPDGRVRSASPFAPPDLRPVGQCIAREMSTWRLVVPDAVGDSTITWPFDIDPGEN